jgi:hypothetical protein
MLGSDLSAAVTNTTARSWVKYDGGEYCPVALMVPGPVLGSPPLADQSTVAASPSISFAEN